MDPTIQTMFLEVMQQASSQDPNVLKQAELILKEWEVKPGFFTMLFNVFGNHNVDANLRFTAVIYFKISLDKYWRKNAPIGAVSEEEKRTLRQGLLTILNEPLNPMAIQLAVVISRIGRIDFPNDWPDLTSTLVQAMGSSDSLIQHRAILCFYYVIKELASKRLAGDRRRFIKFTSEHYTMAVTLWNEFSEKFLSSVEEHQPADVINVHVYKAVLAIKIVRKFTIYGIYEPRTNENCMKFLHMIFDQAVKALLCRKMLKENFLIDKCEKYIVNLVKLLAALLNQFPFTFVEFIQPTLEFIAYYVFNDACDGLLFEKFIIHCFNLMKSILLCEKFRNKNIGDNREYSPQAIVVIKDFFQTDVLNVIVKKLLTHYFLLTKEDLEQWDVDPETFSIDEAGESWKYSLRPSMETLFVTLFRRFHSELSPLLVGMVREMNVIVPPDDMHAILRKDALYNAIGLASYSMHDYIDFDTWYRTLLTEELKIKHQNYRVIRRRVIWLIGIWVSVQLSSNLRPMFYSDIVALLHPTEDMALRMTASFALRHAIDDFLFNVDQFQPFVQVITDLLFTLLRDANECESKMLVLNVLTIMTERVGELIIPYSKMYINYLPILWKDAGDHDLLRCAIVASLVEIVKVYGDVNEEFYPLLLPIIQLGTDISQRAGVYLLEDALELWQTVIENSKAMTNELMLLYNNMFALFADSTENLRHCLIITLAYLLLAPELMMKTHGYQIVNTLDAIMGDIRQEGILLLLSLIENFIKSSPVVGCETVKPILPRIFQFILQMRNDEFPIIFSAYLSIISRVLLTSHDVFTQTLRELSFRNNQNEQQLWTTLLDIWLQAEHRISQLNQRKLIGLAFANLLTVNNQQVIERIPRMLTCIVEILHDIMDDNEATDSLVLVEGQNPGDFIESHDEEKHDQRHYQLVLNDPVHNIVLKHYLQSQILELQSKLGQIQYMNLLQALDPDIQHQLSEYINLSFPQQQQQQQQQHQQQQQLQQQQQNCM